MPNSLQIALHNNSTTSDIFAYVSGISIQNGQRCLLKSNGTDLYYPQNPPSVGSPLTEDVAIPLSAPGSTTNLTIPQIAGGRLWFSRAGKLTFLLNPGPALVEPSVLNPSDPNAQLDFGFCEFTLNDAQFYGNISYVDFVPRLPIGISLRTAGGATQVVQGMHADGLQDVAAKLGEQGQRDGRPWEKLVVQGQDGAPLRVLNATHGEAVGASFAGYFEPYVEKVWEHYGGRPGEMKINTQAGPGVLGGTIKGDQLHIGEEPFGKPSTADILGCNSGPFTTGPNQTRNAIIPRLAAAFVRTSLLDASEHPSHPDGFYRSDPTNHYARIVHEVNADGKGYAFAYDDVQPDGGEDQSGKVNAGDPVVLDVSVGGGGVGRGQDRGPPQPAPPGGGPPQGQQQVPMGGEQQQQQDGHHGFRNKLGGLMQKVMK